ncbi:MAG TPA: hypothetical protein VEA80_18105 [Vitreimonas sp.]|uniref:hypothetical protein n=1 Tax=Vitreimonas sp. TaxID=3069702 RepID=UPI002D581196|nr:hypothetical protein [Vitreimonas sp.]HYD89398.1 hypothetical protein [Vitreimonas sp.]
MIAWKFKAWRTAGAAVALTALAACGEGGEGGEPGQAGEAGEGDGAATAPAGEAGEAAIGEAGGEHGEAGVASAYAGLTGDQLTVLRLNHLKGFVMAAEAIAANSPDEAAVLVQQGLLEVYDPAADRFGSLNADIVRAAADLSATDRVQRLNAAEAEIDRAASALDGEPAVTAARMVDIASGLYQHVVQADFVDPIEYQHSMGAALAAQAALRAGESEMRRQNAGAYNEARREIDRFVALWPQPTAPETATSYRQVLAQSSRVRLALSPFL